MIRGWILVPAFGGPAMAQPRTEPSIYEVHEACISRALGAANAMLDDPARPSALDIVLRKYRTVLRAVYDGCMTENGYQLRTDLSFCTTNDLPRAAFGCYRPIR